MFGIQQALRGPPDPVAVPVELEGGDPVDGFAAPFCADAVVALGGGDAAVVHQFFEDVRRYAGVGMPLRVAVLSRTRHRSVILGFTGHGSDTRWLNHEEISEGVLAALRSPQDGGLHVVGRVRPWEDRP
ncbi:hypothetical protein ACFWBI_30490 [Streptomyces sp. NPDC059982]|uniref:hypothetical protein n=1 Tax=unclassified Streptomyces TaxID=2593676 RepID=UPI0036BE9416